MAPFGNRELLKIDSVSDIDVLFAGPFIDRHREDRIFDASQDLGQG